MRTIGQRDWSAVDDEDWGDDLTAREREAAGDYDETDPFDRVAARDRSDALGTTPERCATAVFGPPQPAGADPGSNPEIPGCCITRNTERFLDDVPRMLAACAPLRPVDRIALALMTLRTSLAALYSGDAATARAFLPDAIAHLERAAATLDEEAVR